MLTVDEVRSLKLDEAVVLLIETIGCDEHDQEILHPAGAAGVVSEIRTLPAPQGTTVTILVGAEDDSRIVATFDESDESGFAFRRADQGETAFTVDALMESAGAELMALSFRMEEHPEFAADAKRVQRIGAWASVHRPSDFERGALQVMGAMMDVMRRRNYAFSEHLPMAAQFAEMLSAVPDPLPGESCYVDQSTVAPDERRDVFDAEVDLGEVRTWTAHDGVPRSIATNALVRPRGTKGRCIVHAEGDAASLLVEGTTVVLRLRASGRALAVVGAGEMDPPAPTMD